MDRDIFPRVGRNFLLFSFFAFTQSLSFLFTQSLSFLQNGTSKLLDWSRGGERICGARSRDVGSRNFIVPQPPNPKFLKKFHLSVAKISSFGGPSIPIFQNMIRRACFDRKNVTYFDFLGNICERTVLCVCLLFVNNLRIICELTK